MIGRGDLASEWSRDDLADVQEGILSICSDALVPVICPVLESLIKSGVPTRTFPCETLSSEASYTKTSSIHAPIELLL